MEEEAAEVVALGAALTVAERSSEAADKTEDNENFIM